MISNIWCTKNVTLNAVIIGKHSKATQTSQAVHNSHQGDVQGHCSVNTGQHSKFRLYTIAIRGMFRATALLAQDIILKYLWLSTTAIMLWNANAGVQGSDYDFGLLTATVILKVTQVKTV